MIGGAAGSELLEGLARLTDNHHVLQTRNLVIIIKETGQNSAFELGLLLALKMGQEIREKKPLGSESGDLVVSWKDRYSEYVIEEAIASAKEFLLHPASIAEKIKAGMDKFNKVPEDAGHDEAGHDEAESKDQNEA